MLHFSCFISLSQPRKACRILLVFSAQKPAISVSNIFQFSQPCRYLDYVPLRTQGGIGFPFCSFAKSFRNLPSSYGIFRVHSESSESIRRNLPSQYGIFLCPQSGMLLDLVFLDSKIPKPHKIDRFCA